MNSSSPTKYYTFVHYSFLVSLAAIGFFLPFRVHYSNVASICALFFWLLNIRAYWPSNFLHSKRALMIFLSLYAIQIVGLIHTANMDNGLFVLEKKLPLLLMPLIILVANLSNAEIKKIGYVFIAGVVLSAAYLYYVALGKIIEGHLSLSVFFTDPAFQNQFFTGVLDGMHPAYYTLFLSLGIFVMVYELIEKKQYYLIVNILIIAFLLVTMVISMSRGGILAFFAAMIVFLGYKAIVGKRYVLLISGVVGAFLLMVAMVSAVPNLKTRLMDSFDGMTSGLDDNEIESPKIHAKSWYCAMSSSMDEHFAFGNGTGDEEDVLKSCYAGNGWESMATIGYDSHNEYLSQFVKQGIVGLLILLFCFGYPMVRALKEDQVIYLLFLVIVVIAAFSESILRGKTSLVFYAFFNALFFKQLLNDRWNASVVSVNS